MSCAYALLILLALPPATTAAAPAVDRSTPQAAMQAMADAVERGDPAAIAAGIRLEGDADGKVAAALARQLVAVRTYWRAMWKRFGRREAFDAYVKRGIVLPDVYLEWPLAKWKIEGDRAHADRGADFKGPHGLTPLRRVDGQWYFDPQHRPSEKDRAFILDFATREAAKYERLARDIEAGKLAGVHEAIDVLSPRPRPAEPQKLAKEQLDPATIQGAMMSLGQAYQDEDAAAAAKFYHADGPGGAQLAEAHVKHALAVHRFTRATAAQEGGGESLAMEFGLVDRRDDLFGHLLTEWTVAGDRATGVNDAGPAAATLRRVDGIWKIDLTPPAGAPPAEKLAEELRRRTKIVAAVTADIAEKRLFTVDEVRRELKRRGLAPAIEPAGAGEGAGEVDVN